MNKKKQLKIALEICAKTWDIGLSELNEIIREPKKVYANMPIKHAFRAVMSILSEKAKENGYQYYTKAEIAALENKYGSGAHCNVLESTYLFNDTLKGKGKDGNTKSFKIANYFLQEYLRKEF